MKIKNCLAIVMLFFSSACHKKKPIAQKFEEIIVQQDPIDKNKQYNFVIVTSDYAFESDYYGIIQNEYSRSGKSLELNKHNISFGKYKDVLMLGKYKSAGAYYPVQFDFLRGKIYLSVYKADEMEGIFEYNKILEYDIENDSIREIISFLDYFNSWYLSTVSNKIYGIDTSSKSIIGISLDTLEVDTFYTDTSYFEEIEYHVDDDKSLDIITFDRKNGVTKFNINYTSNELTKTDLYRLTSFSSYIKNAVIQTYKDFRNNIEQLRIYNKSENKSIPFNFKNFNTFWINDFEFVATKKDEIQKINANLNILNSYKLENIHVIEVTSNLIFVSYHENNENKVGALAHDFAYFMEIPNIKSENIVAIEEK